jgi:hypothetical protein
MGFSLVRKERSSSGGCNRYQETMKGIKIIKNIETNPRKKRRPRSPGRARTTPSASTRLLARGPGLLAGETGLLVGKTGLLVGKTGLLVG